MWSKNPLTKMLDIQLPIIQAPMAGGATTPELVAAVSNAGGLGSLGAAYMTPQNMAITIQKIRQLTDKPFAVNLFVPGKPHANDQQVAAMCAILAQEFSELDIPATPMPASSLQVIPFAEQLAVVIEEKVPVFSFTFGIPDAADLAKLRENNTIIIGTATNLAEGKQLEQAGVDMVVAQGYEAGGHRGTFARPVEDAYIGSFALIPQLVDHLSIPVVAAGAIMDGRSIVAALALGAAGVQLGTAFLTCSESGIHPTYKQRLLDTQEEHTTLTRLFTGRAARAMKNTFIQRMAAYEHAVLDFPLQNFLTRPVRMAAEQQNNTEFMSLYSGQGAHLCQALSATQLIEKLQTEVEAILKNHRFIA